MRKLLTFIAIVVGGLSLPVVAGAQQPNNDTFGHHVATCAHEMGGFDGTHNPGMHQDRSGWDGSAC